MYVANTRGTYRTLATYARRRHHGDGTYHHAKICLLLAAMQSWTPSAPTQTQGAAAARETNSNR